MGKFIKAAGIIDSYTGLNGVFDGKSKANSQQKPGEGMFNNQYQFPAGNAKDVEMSPASRKGVGDIDYKGGMTKDRGPGKDLGPINFHGGKIKEGDVFKD